MSQPLPHPVTGELFESPVPPGTGWPGEYATSSTPAADTPEQVSALAAGSSSLAELDALVSTCRACPRLVEWREQVASTKRASFADQPYWGRPVSGWGDPAPHSLIVGLAPAANGANRTGRIFTGDNSGNWLYAALFRAGFANQPSSQHAGDGLELTGVRITAPVHCAPPANAPTTHEKATCAPWLDREVTLVEPDLRSILALGGIGWQQVLVTARRLGWSVPRPAPKFGHGAEAVLVTTHGREVRLVGCYHVSQQNTFTGKLTEQMLDEVLGRLREH